MLFRSNISDTLPEEYFPEVERNHPGALASQWIPQDKELWKIENYREFLEARKNLLAEETNKRLEELLHGETTWLEGPVVMPEPRTINVGIETEMEEKDLIELNKWIEQQQLTPGILAYELADIESGRQKAVFDLAWPSGLQEGLSESVAVLINEGSDVLYVASQAGFRCFTGIDEFKNYVKAEILKEEFING